MIDIDFLINLNSSDIILTPNQRLANTLEKALEKRYTQLKHQTFVSPIILSFSSFIRTLWKSYIFVSPKKLLTNHEEAWLWQKIINDSIISKELLNTQKVASLVQSAWHHLIQWNFSIEQIKAYLNDNDNLTHFNTWAESFLHLCEENEYLDESSALRDYSDNIAFLENLPYKNIYFYHFIEKTPLQEKLINRLQQYNKNVIDLQQKPLNQILNRFELESSTEELHHMAIWAKQEYIKNPNAIIGCVIPALHEKRNEVHRAFKQAFNDYHPPIDISAGYLLSEFCIIQHILLLIHLQNEKFDYEIFSTYLCSAYFSHAETEINLRSILDLKLRKNCSKTTSTQQITEHAGINLVPHLVKSSSQSLSCWCRQWLDFLKQLGWPGQRNLDSTEYQVAQRFIKLLDEIEELDILQNVWTWQEFSLLLISYCQQTIFQAESEKTSIQVLGLLEASGMTFDALWIMGLDDKTLPSAPSPNPFLPYLLQKKYQFPHASAEREYNFCKELLEQLIQSGQNVIISNPQYDADKELRPSPLITKIKKTFEFKLFSEHNKREKPIAFQVERLIDNIAPPVLENEKITGGSSIVQQEALCPFKAFANIRLHSQPMPELLDAPNSLMRGKKIHRALEVFWNKIKNSTRLLQLTDKEFFQQIEYAVNLAHQESPYHDQFFTDIEKIRLNKILHQWLMLEKKRSSFSVIATEEYREYQYKNITLKLRIDRIDEANDGEHIIIDYKTGISSIQHWFGQRMKEPQLPLYCITHSTTVSAMFFAQIRWNDFSIKGLSHNEHELDTVVHFDDMPIEMRSPSWQEQKIQWKNSIDDLLEDFLTGKADVDPIDQTVCEYCHLQALCRIFDHDE